MPKIAAVTQIKVEEEQKQLQNKKAENQKKFQMAKDGILVDNFIKEDSNKNVDFEAICDRLVISQKEQKIPNYSKNDTKSSFRIKKTLTPLLLGTASVFAGTA